MEFAWVYTIDAIFLCIHGVIIALHAIVPIYTYISALISTFWWTNLSRMTADPQKLQTLYPLRLKAHTLCIGRGCS